MEFEKDFARFHGARHGVAVTNGTAALEVAIAALGIGQGDEVILPNFTFVATASAVLFANALPVLVDVDPETYCIDTNLAEAAITPRTKAIIAVHMGGHPADLDGLKEICQRHKLVLVEDSSHAHASEWRGQRIGTFGVAGTFSFQSSKLMTAGEGGAVVTSRLEFYERAQTYTNCGRASQTDKFRHRFIGHNYRMTEFQAAILEVQLKRYPRQSKVRLANMDYFEKRLRGTPGIEFLKRDPRQTRVAPYQYVFKYRAEHFGASRSSFLGALEVEGIPCDGLFYEPVYKSPLFPADPAAFPALSWGQPEPLELKSMYHCPVSERAAYEEAVWLPHHIFLGTRKDVDDISDAILKVCENSAELRGLNHPAIARKTMSRAERPRIEKRQY